MPLENLEVSERMGIILSIRTLLRHKMPDGTSVTAHCRVGMWIWSSVTSCVEPSLGKYDAMIEKHGLHLLIPVQGRRATEIKFSFE